MFFNNYIITITKNTFKKKYKIFYKNKLHTNIIFNTNTTTLNLITPKSFLPPFPQKLIKNKKKSTPTIKTTNPIISKIIILINKKYLNINSKLINQPKTIKNNTISNLTNNLNNITPKKNKTTIKK